MSSALNENELRPADEPLSRLEEQLAKLAQDFVSRSSDPQTTPLPMDRIEPDAAVARDKAAAGGDSGISSGGWALRGFIGILLAAGIGVAAFSWLGSSGNGGNNEPAQPAPPPQAAVQATPVQTKPVQPAPVQQTTLQPAPSQPAPSQPALSQPAAVAKAAAPAESSPLLQSMARDLASQGNEIEQLKASRELLARDNANLGEQLQATQQQLTSSVAQVSERLKTSQEQAARDAANIAEQIKAIQEQLARINTKFAEQDARPAIAAASSRAIPLRPRTTIAPLHKPVPTPGSPQAAAIPKPVKPKLPAPPPAPAR